MKTVLSILWLLLLNIHCVQCQNFGFNAKTGISNAKMESESGHSFSNSILNYSLGIQYNLPVFQQNEISLNLSYLRTGYGFRIKQFLDEGKVRANVPIQYVRFAPTFTHGLDFSNKKRRKKQKRYFEAILGGYFSYKLSSKWNHPRDGGEIEESVSIKSVDYGFVFGLQYVTDIRRVGKLKYFFRYSQGLSNILDHPFNEARLRGYFLGVEYFFEKRKKKRKK